MAKKESTQHKLDRVRAPRVQLTYDVEVGDAIEKKELPFVAGVIGDFTGQPAEPLAKLKERKFVNIDKDNFDDVLKGMKPRVQMQVEDRLKGDGGGLISIFYHPCEWVHQEFWDGVNFKRGWKIDHRHYVTDLAHSILNLYDSRVPAHMFNSVIIRPRKESAGAA